MTISSPSRERCTPSSARSNSASATKSRSETASSEFSNLPAEAEILGDAVRVERQAGAAERARAERLRRRPGDGVERAGRRRERAPSRGRAGDGRGAPAGHAADGCSRGGRRPRPPSRAASSTRLRAPRILSTTSSELATGVEPQIRRDLVVSAPPGVELRAGRAGDLGDPPLDRRMDVLVARLEDERPAFSSSLDAVEAARSVAASSARDDGRAASPRTCAREPRRRRRRADGRTRGSRRTPSSVAAGSPEAARPERHARRRRRSRSAPWRRRPGLRARAQSRTKPSASSWRNVSAAS